MIILTLTPSELAYLSRLLHLEMSFDYESRHISDGGDDAETLLTKVDDASGDPE